MPCDDGGKISLREYFDAQHASLKDLLDTQSDGIDRALMLQREEYARRLGELNHAHEEARRVLNTYIPREVYDQKQQQMDVKYEKLETRCRELENAILVAKSIADEKLAQATKTFVRITVTTGIVVALFTAMMALAAVMTRH